MPNKSGAMNILEFYTLKAVFIGFVADGFPLIALIIDWILIYGKRRRWKTDRAMEVMH